jgi:HPt (histidine-containing phosphotransfer) domain-containing protein
VARSGALPAPLAAQARTVAQGIGVQIEQAVERMGGNVPVYGRMLRTFLADLPATLDRARQQVAQKDWASLAIGMHTLKGLAGMLGAGELARVSADLEQAGQRAVTASRGSAGGPLKAGADDPASTSTSQRDEDDAAWAQQLDAVQAAAEPLRSQGAELVALLLATPVAVPSRPESTSLPALDPAQAGLVQAADAPQDEAVADGASVLQRLLGQLASHLEASDMQAVEWMERLRVEGVEHGADVASDLEALGDAVDRLDFERALGLCQAMMASEVR